MLSSNNLKIEVEEASPDCQPQSTADVKVHTGEDLPLNVTEVWQLEQLPEKYLSQDPRRPLLSTDDSGIEYRHALKPMFFSVVFILVVEGLERLSYYGVSYTQTSYLTGVYNPTWSANLTSVEASSWVSTSTAIAYSVPFIGAILADAFLGNYYTILFGALVFYLPGLLLIALTAYPGLLGETFNTTAIAVGLLFFYPVGAGFIKASVSVFGAQQYHPLLQSVEQYYVRFYMTINIGALIGGICIPILCQSHTFAAYMIPVGGLALATTIFVAGTPRYVRLKPQGNGILTSLKASFSTFKHCPPSLNKNKESNGGKYPDLFVEKVKLLLAVIPTTGLIVPFNIVYSQMSTTFIIQGTVMENAGFIDASWMQNFDAFSVIFFGFIISQFFYPFLARRGIKLHITTKFAIGTTLCALAMACAIIVDYKIHDAYAESNSQISILWQAFSFVFIGAGEIFAISSAYEAAFVIAPADQKALASAFNLFLIGAVPNFISTAILNACSKFFQDNAGSGDLKTIQQYSQSQIYNFFWILFGIACAGVLINLLPPVRRYLNYIEEKAEEVKAATLAQQQKTEPSNESPAEP